MLHLTHSQESYNIPKSDSTSIAYFRINEYEKYRRAYFVQDSVITTLTSKIEVLENRLANSEDRIDSFKNVVIPKLEKLRYTESRDHELELVVIENEQFLLENKLKIQRGKKWLFGVIGVVIGVVLSVVVVVSP